MKFAAMWTRVNSGKTGDILSNEANVSSAAGLLCTVQLVNSMVLCQDAETCTLQRCEA